MSQSTDGIAWVGVRICSATSHHSDSTPLVNGTAVTAVKDSRGTTGHRQDQTQLYCKQDPMSTTTVRKINEPSPNSSRVPSYANAESRGARNASDALIPCAQREDFDENYNSRWHEPVSDVQESNERQHTMSSSRRFVENTAFTTISTSDLLRLVSVYMNILFYIR